MYILAGLIKIQTSSSKKYHRVASLDLWRFGSSDFLSCRNVYKDLHSAQNKRVQIINPFQSSSLECCMHSTSHNHFPDRSTYLHVFSSNLPRGWPAVSVPKITNLYNDKTVKRWTPSICTNDYSALFPSPGWRPTETAPLISTNV